MNKYDMANTDTKEEKTGDEEICSNCGRTYQRSLKSLHHLLVCTHKKQGSH